MNALGFSFGRGFHSVVQPCRYIKGSQNQKEMAHNDTAYNLILTLKSKIPYFMLVFIHSHCHVFLLFQCRDGGRKHQGIDIVCAAGSFVYAPFPAEVKRGSAPYSCKKYPQHCGMDYNSGILLEGTGSWAGKIFFGESVD